MTADPYSVLVGSPSDEVPAIRATGTGELTSLYVSLSARHPEGRDAEYLAWHTLDHRPEQYRLSAIKAAVRLVSTPACRAARASAEPPFDAVDHVMMYFFSDLEGLRGFDDLAVALRGCGRMPYALPSVQPGIFGIEERLAHPKIKAGGDVLPWWPAKGAYLLIEDGESVSLHDMMDVSGVVGGWRGSGQPGRYSKAGPTQRVSLLFLDDDPVVTGSRIAPALAERWRKTAAKPLLAAPFQFVVPHEWERHLP